MNMPSVSRRAENTRGDNKQPAPFGQMNPTGNRGKLLSYTKGQKPLLTTMCEYARTTTAAATHQNNIFTATISIMPHNTTRQFLRLISFSWKKSRKQAKWWAIKPTDNFLLPCFPLYPLKKKKPTAFRTCRFSNANFDEAFSYPANHPPCHNNRR